MMTFDKSTGDLAPGVYDIPEDVYHSDPVPGGSLSCSGARRILDCPMKFRWERDHPVYKDVFDFGQAAHRQVLGAGYDIDVHAFPDWRTKAAKEAKEQSRANGSVPLLTADWETIQAMAAAIRAHPIASALLDPARGGQPEQSLIWRDAQTPVTLRCRLDWLPPVPESGRMILPDYKTSADARRPAFSRSVANFGYHQQHAFYVDGVSAVLGVDDPAFVFIAQEREPPYLVAVYELDPYAVTIGRERNRRAVDLYLECRSTGVWPGYSNEVETISLPRWAEMAHEAAMEQGTDDAPW